MLLSSSLFSVHPERVMRKFFQLLAVFPGLFALPLAAQAKVRITVDLSSQQMDVRSDGGASYSWPISSARAGYVTPNGVYSAVSLQTMHRSKKYHNSPMPHSIFFHGGYAIHGTYDVGALGRPASHGCVRISPANAATLFSLVRSEGATIEIVGSPPPSHRFASESRHPRHYAHAHRAHYARSGHGHPTSALSYAPARSSAFPANVFGYVLH
jgi:hypothetical protein